MSVGGHVARAGRETEKGQEGSRREFSFWPRGNSLFQSERIDLCRAEIAQEQGLAKRIDLWRVPTKLASRNSYSSATRFREIFPDPLTPGPLHVARPVI